MSCNTPNWSPGRQIKHLAGVTVQARPAAPSADQQPRLRCNWRARRGGAGRGSHPVLHPRRGGQACVGGGGPLRTSRRQCTATNDVTGARQRRLWATTPPRCCCCSPGSTRNARDTHRHTVPCSRECTVFGEVQEERGQPAEGEASAPRQMSLTAADDVIRTLFTFQCC